jgi:hypothetical protein
MSKVHYPVILHSWETKIKKCWFCCELPSIRNILQVFCSRTLFSANPTSLKNIIYFKNSQVVRFLWSPASVWFSSRLLEKQHGWLPQKTFLRRYVIWYFILLCLLLYIGVWVWLARLFAHLMWVIKKFKKYIKIK